MSGKEAEFITVEKLSLHPCCHFKCLAFKPFQQNSHALPNFSRNSYNLILPLRIDCVWHDRNTLGVEKKCIHRQVFPRCGSVLTTESKKKRKLQRCHEHIPLVTRSRVIDERLFLLLCAGNFDFYHRTHSWYQSSQNLTRSTNRTFVRLIS